jgi:hypothetical protein
LVVSPCYFSRVSLQDLKSEIERMPSTDRRQLAAFLVTLRHRDMAGYRSELARKIDDQNPDNWVAWEDLGRRLGEE